MKILKIIGILMLFGSHIQILKSESREEKSRREFVAATEEIARRNPEMIKQIAEAAIAHPEIIQQL